jgi:phage shock protein PspC (stress-responsive transcriptional regulator)
MDISETLERLSALHQAGALSDSEYASAKARVIGDGPTQASDATAQATPAAQAAPAPRPADFLHRLHRSRKDRWFGGVCGGLGVQIGVPGWFLRMAFLIAACVFGSGVLLYILLWIFVPQEPVVAPAVSGAAHA